MRARGVSWTVMEDVLGNSAMEIAQRPRDMDQDGGNDAIESELTTSKPLLATILILFGIGYTIDYNSMSHCLKEVQ
jgi:hypothetical protein